MARSATDIPATQPIAGVEWYDLADPDSTSLDELAQRFHLHELQIEDCRHRPQRAKTEDHEAYTFSVLKTIRDKQTIVFDEVDVFLGRDFLVTVHKGECGVIERLRRRAQEDGVRRLDKLVYYLLDQTVDEYIPRLDELAEETAHIESVVLHRPDPATLRRIFHLKRKLIEFRRVAAGMREVVNALMRKERGLLGDDLDPYLRDVYDHLVRTLDLIESYRDLLTGSLDIYLSAVANRTNEVMKLLTIWGTVALPLVIITGFFGMNLHVPWGGSRWGAGFAGGLMLLSSVLILLYFKRKGWF